jgi:hypothetical protein
MSDAPPKIGDTRPAPDGELCPTGGKRGCSVREVVHVPVEQLRSLRRLADRAKHINALRRESALWRAGIRYGASAEVLLQRLPNDVDLDDPEAVRQECSAIVAGLLGARDQLAEVGS